MQGVCRDVSRHVGSGDDARTRAIREQEVGRMVRDRCANRNHMHHHWRQVRVFLPRGALVLPRSRPPVAVSDDALSYAAVSSWRRCNAITDELTPERSPSCQNPAPGEACTSVWDERDCTFVSLKRLTCECDYTEPDPYPYDPSFGSWLGLQLDWRTLVEGSQACAPDLCPSITRLLAPIHWCESET